jgi:hypothetical protein
LMKEALGSSETSVLTGATRRNISEDAILHSHRREHLKSYIMALSQLTPSPTATHPHQYLTINYLQLKKFSVTVYL